LALIFRVQENGYSENYLPLCENPSLIPKAETQPDQSQSTSQGMSEQPEYTANTVLEVVFL